MRAAQQTADGYWGGVCAGEVHVDWGALDGSVLAHAEWASTNDSARYTACSVVFNDRQEWDWPTFCTVMTHEYGHLTGHEHTSSGVMAATYGGPISQCKGTAPASQPPQPPPAPQPAPTLAPEPAAGPAAEPAPAAAPAAEPIGGPACLTVILTICI